MSNLQISSLLPIAAITLLAFSTNACGDAASPTREFRIDGELNPTLAGKIENTDFQGITRISVNSFGGDTISAVRIARKLKNSDLPIIIDGMCSSACMMIAIIDNGNVEFRDGSLFLLHNTATSTYLMSSTPYKNISESAFKNAMDIEREWTSENGVELRFLLLPQMMIDTLCLSGPKSDDPQRYKEFVYASTYIGWVPSPEIARGFGMNFKGKWTLDADSIDRSLKTRRYSKSAKDLMLLQPNPGSDSTLEENIVPILQSIPNCDSLWSSKR